jgi:hypothetical protein
MTFQQWREDLEARWHERDTALRKKVSLQNVARQPSRPTKLYLAGKIFFHDWRHDLIPDLAMNSIEEWRDINSVPICDGLEYVGPFFIADDHGCSHGANSHGASGECGVRNPRLHEEVLIKSLEGIKACDLFVVWAEKDFPTAYGTMAEIGMARALNKRIVIIHRGDRATTEALRDLWFPLVCGEIIHAETPGEGILRLFDKKEHERTRRARIKIIGA